MIRIRHLAIAALAVLLPLAAAQAINTASADLVALDKTTTTGYLEARIALYPAPDTKGNAGTPGVYPAQLLFSRDGRFRLVLRPGASNEYRLAAGGDGLVSWIDMGTGNASKGRYATLVDPFVRTMLGTVGAITRFAPMKELPMGSNPVTRGATLQTNVYGSGIVSGRAWFGNDRPTGFEFVLSDNRRVFVSVLSFKQNVTVKAADFAL